MYCERDLLLSLSLRAEEDSGKTDEEKKRVGGRQRIWEKKRERYQRYWKIGMMVILETYQNHEISSVRTHHSWGNARLFGKPGKQYQRSDRMLLDILYV